MLKYYKVIITIFIISCMGCRQYSLIKFKHIDSNNKKQQRILYYLKIPKGCHTKIYKAGGESGLEYQFWYPDSSVVYITDMNNGLNNYNINISGYGGIKFEFYIKQHNSNRDTLLIDGIDSKGFYWKEIIINYVSYGYMNVSDKRKEEFDKLLFSVRYRRGFPVFRSF